MRLTSIVGSIVLAIAVWVTSARAETRVALVIGNGIYRNVAILPNPTNDADDVAASLERLGFAIRRVTNGSFEEMRRALRDFVPLAQRSEMALVYFAGHGMEIAGENWLIPVDAELITDIAADQEAISLRTLLQIVGGASKVGLVILDACRNNPFAARMQRSVAVRAVDRGLVRVEPTGSVLVAYAAKEGTTASDGTGRNSPFTRALLHNIETPGLEINYLFRNIRDEVIRATNQRQEPFVYGSLSREEIYLKPADKLSAPIPSFPTLQMQVKAFDNFIRTSTAAEIAKGFPDERPDVKFDVLISEDINADSYLDFVVLHTSRYFCGSGGCSMNVYVANPKGEFSAVLDLFGYTSPRISSHKTNGFKDIAAVRFSVKEMPVWSIHQWNGKEYKLAYDKFCGRVALEYCTDDAPAVMIERVPDNTGYTLKAGARSYEEPGGRAFKDTLDPTSSVVGKVRGTDWYLVQIWKDTAGFVSGKYIARSTIR